MTDFVIKSFLFYLAVYRISRGFILINMKSVISVVLLAWIVLVPPAECSKGQPANTVAQTQQAVSFVEQGDAYFNRGSYDEALNAYSTAHRT